MTYLQRTGSVMNGRYNPQNTRSTIQVLDEMIRISPDSVKRLQMRNKKSSLLFALCWAYRDKADTEEIEFIRENIKKIPADITDTMDSIGKICYVLRVYAPIRLTRFLTKLWYMIKGQRAGEA